MDGITWFGIALVVVALVLSIRKDLKHAKALSAVEAELERWRVNAEEARRWLVEFPDVAIALDHVMRCAAGVENPEFISDVRDAMRVKSDRRMMFLAPFYAASADVPSRTEDEFRVAYQHLSSECCGDDTPAKPSRWLGLGGA